ncbi:unnamed protein product [Clavelina lepadiformis]|uniref:Coiled-coil domain-containing protein 102A n=1 Tax=Clavelina lepadiformis TaxID=159417 RepID=A0ABP0H0X9_CLALP
MSGEIMNGSRHASLPNSHHASSSNQPHSRADTRERDYRPKPRTRRSKTPSRGDLINANIVNQFSSADSESEIMIDQEPNKMFYESNRPMKRGRLGKNEHQRRSKSRERSLENTLKAPSFGSYIQLGDEEYSVDVPEYPHPLQLRQQRRSSHQRSSTLPNTRPLAGQDISDAEISELMNLRVRAEQMEKTLRWWSDCTANWREKWTKVRAERNRAREEAKIVKTELEEAKKELVVLRQQRSLLVEENRGLRGDTPFKDGSASEESSSLADETSRGLDISSTNKSYQVGSQRKQGKGNSVSSSSATKIDEDHLSQKIVGLQLRVDESAKTIQAERNSKLTLNKSIEQLEEELSSVKHKYNEIKEAKQEVLKQMTRIQESHRSEVVRLNQNLEEELENRSFMEKKIHDLREEIERLQEENTSEWGKRERLETEKLQLERDSKRLKSIADELKSSLDRKMKATMEDRDNELRLAHAEIQDLSEELNNLRHQSSREQKLLDDKQEELNHSRRRGEQHETEVRTLRTRVEELKKQQTTTEDELDNAQNQVRKYIRVVEEKDEELEKLNLQITQMHTSMFDEA